MALLCSAENEDGVCLRSHNICNSDVFGVVSTYYDFQFGRLKFRLVNGRYVKKSSFLGYLPATYLLSDYRYINYLIIINNKNNIK